MSDEAVIEAIKAGEEYAPEPWPKPDMSIIVGSRLLAPPPPVDIFQGFWGDWIHASAESKSTPPDFVLAFLLAVASSLIGNARRVSPWPGWEEPSNLWFIAVGNPSSGKSPALDTSLDLVRTLQDEAAQGYPEKLRQYKTALETSEIQHGLWEKQVQKAVKDGTPPPLMSEAEEPPEKPHKVRLYTTDATLEATCLLMYQNPRGLLLIRDEISGWLGNMDRYGGKGGDRSFWLEAFGGKSFSVDRVKYLDNPIHVPRLSISITGGIQPDRLAKMLLSGDDDGLAARFNYIWPEPVPPKRPASRVDNTAALSAFRRLRALNMAVDETGNPYPVILPLASESLDLVDAFRLENAALQASESGLFLSYIGKLPGVMLRIALVLEHLWWAGDCKCSDPPNTVSLAAVAAAMDFTNEYLIPMARRTFADACLPQQIRDAATVARYIQDSHLDSINVREITRKKLSGIKESAQTKAALIELEAVGWVRHAPTREGDTPGRKKGDYIINPLLWEET